MISGFVSLLYCFEIYDYRSSKAFFYLVGLYPLPSILYFCPRVWKLLWSASSHKRNISEQPIAQCYKIHIPFLLPTLPRGHHLHSAHDKDHKETFFHNMGISTTYSCANSAYMHHYQEVGGLQLEV
jgi:hypothetical protein